jgi:hypothetical protein
MSAPNTSFHSKQHDNHKIRSPENARQLTLLGVAVGGFVHIHIGDLIRASAAAGSARPG